MSIMKFSNYLRRKTAYLNQSFLSESLSDLSDDDDNLFSTAGGTSEQTGTINAHYTKNKSLPENKDNYITMVPENPPKGKCYNFDYKLYFFYEKFRF